MTVVSLGYRTWLVGLWEGSGGSGSAPRAFVGSTFFFLPYCTAYEILVPGPGIKPTISWVGRETLTTGPLGDVPDTFLQVFLTDSF